MAIAYLEDWIKGSGAMVVRVLSGIVTPEKSMWQSMRLMLYRHARWHYQPSTLSGRLRQLGQPAIATDQVNIFGPQSTIRNERPFVPICRSRSQHLVRSATLAPKLVDGADVVIDEVNTGTETIG